MNNQWMGSGTDFRGGGGGKGAGEMGGGGEKGTSEVSHRNLDLPLADVQIVFAVDKHPFQRVPTAGHRTLDEEDEREAPYNTTEPVTLRLSGGVQKDALPGVGSMRLYIYIYMVA